MAQLTLHFKHGYNGMETARDFPSGDERLAMSYRQVGLFRRWHITVGLERDGLTEKQVQWIMLRLDGSLAKAVLETRSIGFTGHRNGELFRMVMKGK